MRAALSKLSASLLCLAAVSAAGPAHAAGFYLQETSIAGLGASFSGAVTVLDDASAAYSNPAAMTRLERGMVSGGGTVISPIVKMDDDGTTFDFNGPGAGGVAALGGNDGGNPYRPKVVPALAIAWPFMDGRVWGGLSINAPFGLGNKYNEDWFGRYDSIETHLKTINISPTAAFRITDTLAIGGGIDIQYADATLRAAVSNIASEGESSLEGDDWSYGYNIGLHYTPIPSTVIGAHYRSEMRHELKGRIAVQSLSSGNFDESGTADLNLPDIASFGISHQVDPRLRFNAQATWFGWNDFQEIAPQRDDGVAVAATLQNYKTTWAYAIGAEYTLSDRLVVRGGLQLDETPTRDEARTSRTPDGDRTWFTAGFSYELNDDVVLDVAGGYIDISQERINLTRNSSLAEINATTEGSVSLLAVGVSYKF